MKFVLMFFLFVSSVFSDEWYDVFKTNAENDKYSETSQITKWHEWIADRKMQFLCTKEWTDKSKPEQKDFEIANHLLGKKLGARKCQIIFSRNSDESLENIVKLLWGFSNVGFFPENCRSKYVEVKMEMYEPETFVFQMQISNSQILIFNSQNTPPKYKNVLSVLDEKLETTAKVAFEESETEVSWTASHQIQNIKTEIYLVTT